MYSLATSRRRATRTATSSRLEAIVQNGGVSIAPPSRRWCEMTPLPGALTTIETRLFSEVASRFYDQSQLNRHFVKHLGVTPGGIREGGHLKAVLHDLERKALFVDGKWC